MLHASVYWNTLPQLREATKNNDMDSFHRHLDELERLLSDDDIEKRRIKERTLCYAAYLGSTPVVDALIQKGAGKEFSNENRNISVETCRTDFGG